jgi:hypothetical protein
MTNIWLFDLDGVLVISSGYREALKRTVGHFAAAMGYAENILRDEDIDAFEARGMTSEWDISATCVAALAFAIWQANPALRLPPALPDTLAELRAPRWVRPPPSFTLLAQILKEAPPAATPSHAALEYYRRAARALHADSQRAAEIGTQLSILLERPRDVVMSPVLRYFQHLSLGSQVFAEHYGIPADFPSPSLLETLDKPALSPRMSVRLRQALQTGQIHAAVLTNRPSRPDLPAAANLYPPEAELALRSAGLDFLPHVGSGHMLWLAQRYGKHADAYCKPSAAHALAAIGTALGGTAEAALEAGRQLLEEGRLIAPLAALRAGPVALTVFEDSSTGVVSLRAAAEALQKAGIEATLSAVGIAADGEKRSALQALGTLAFSKIDDALAACFEK